MLKTVLVLAGVTALVLWAARQSPLLPGAAWNALLLAGALLSFFSIAAYALRFRHVMRLLDLELGTLESMRIVSFAVFCQFFVPLGAGADLSKYLKLRGLAPERRARVGAAGIVLEHLLGLFVLVVTATVLFAALRPFAIEINLLEVVAAALLVLMLGGAVLLKRQAAGGLDMRQIVRRLRAHQRAAALAVLWSLTMHLLLAAAVFLGSRGLSVAIDYWQILFVLTSAAVFQAVPATLVGVGVADLAGTGLYVAIGLPLSTALLMVSLLYGYRLLVALLGGLWELDGARRALRSGG